MDMRALLKQMLLIREFERVIKQLARAGTIEGAIHCYTGEEAIAVGVCAALSEQDYLFSTHRGHGHAIARGLPVERVMAELMGRSTGVCGGYGGSMHLFSRDRKLMGGNGIVGGGLTLALGPAYAAKLMNTRDVTVCFFSDGASNEGWFHEAMNMAALWALPLLFVCENNGFAATTPSFKALSDVDVFKRAYGYGMEGLSVDGNDVEAVYEATARAVEKARAGGGPTLVECKTYRVEGHCMVLRDLPRFRPEHEVLRWARKDPIAVASRRMLDAGAMTRDGFAAIEREVADELAAAIAYAKGSPFPDVDDFARRIKERYAI